MKGMSRKLRVSGAALAIGGTVAVIAGCGSSASTSSVAEVPSAAIARAADVSSKVQGYKVGINLRESLRGVGQITVTGRGSFNLPANSGTISMKLGVPTSAGGSKDLRVEGVATPGKIYMKFPPALTSEVPGGKPWWEISLNELGKAGGVPGLGSLSNSANEFNDPAMYLNFLRATSTVKYLGRANVNGIATTHYHAVVDLSKISRVVPTASRKSVQQLVAALSSKGVRTQLPIDAWVDPSHLVRRISLDYGATVSGQVIHLSMQEDFKQFGPQPAPVVPPASETTDIVALLQHATGSAGSATP
jgi:hypothetical protein